MASKTLLTGGTGLLGRELQKYIRCVAPSHREFDITKLDKAVGNYNLIIHCAAYTEVTKAETDRKKCFEANVLGTINLLKAYKNASFVYISSEYAKNPVNYYSETKLAGEVAVKALSKKYLIIRTLFKPNPFPYDKAFFDQYTMGDYIGVIAPLVADTIDKWDKKTCKSIYIGTGRKTILDLAQRTKPLIISTSVRLIKGVKLPNDYL